MIANPPKPELAKQLGAYYTPSAVADFLVNWAVRSANDRVVDPSFGGGVFLEAAKARIIELGGCPANSVFGFELDDAAHALISTACVQFGLPKKNFQQGDFFLATGKHVSTFDAVVGNPPFIRYQNFSGTSRERAALMMEQAGVRVNELASSWAPFVVCGTSVLAKGGRLAMVMPMELCHAGYAKAVLDFLRRSFRTIQLLTFSERLFPHLSQETLLLLADDKGLHCADFRWRHFRKAADLSNLPLRPRVPRSRRLDSDAIVSGRSRLIEEFLGSKVRDLYAELRHHEAIRPLGELAEVGIGYVTGANQFFHLSEADAQHWSIPSTYLRPAACRGRALTGLRFTEKDWKIAESKGEAAYLLALSRKYSLPAVIRRYLAHGESMGVNKSYKCRVREPWYEVPHVSQPDGFLTYMSGIAPRLVCNDAKAVAPNTLHHVRMIPASSSSIEALAVGWRSSLTELSCELEGHAMGGGMLKLEPSEARRVLLALPPNENASQYCEAIDVLSRHANSQAVRASIDRSILRDHLGLSERDCRRICEAITVLRSRRLARSK